MSGSHSTRGIQNDVGEGSCEVSVFAAIDVSGSMGGSKCSEVCASLKELVNQCPDNVLFNITLFSTTAWNAVTALKSGVSMSNLTEDIETAVSRKGMTALYDAIGDTLTNIPESVLKHSIVKIFVLTDGEDNASSRYTKESMMNLSESIMKRGHDVEFHFIQVGQQGNRALLNDLGTLSSSLKGNKIQSVVVDDSSKGIRSAMSTVNKNILLSTRSKNNLGTSSSGTSQATGGPMSSVNKHSMLSTSSKNNLGTSQAAGGTMSSMNKTSLLSTSSKNNLGTGGDVQSGSGNMYPSLNTMRNAFTPSASLLTANGNGGKDLLSTTRPKRLDSNNDRVTYENAATTARFTSSTKFPETASTNSSNNSDSLGSSKSYVLK